MKFGQYELEDLVHPLGGEMYRIFFPNGYGASIVKFETSPRFGGNYGFKEGLYELAVLKGNSDGWSLTYETPVTEDVIGWLTPEDVGKHIEEIRGLESTLKMEVK